MTLISVTEPDEHRAVFTPRSTPGADTATPGALAAVSIPGEVEVTPAPEGGFHQVTIRRQDGVVAETWAVVIPASGTHDLADLERWPLGEAADGGIGLRDRVQELEDTLGGEVFNRLGAHELALQVAEDIFESNLLSEVTWLTASSGRIQIPGYVPQSIARSYRLELDIITEEHASTGDLWIRVMDGESILLHLNFASQVYRSGDFHRYRFAVDFNAPANAALEIAHNAAMRNPTSGRAGHTRPVLTTPIERSA